jgi:hypothetical protein
MLPEFLHNIEDYTNLSSTCRIMRVTMATATPKQILRLAAAQSKVFFRPSPLFLFTATARELGHWARQDDGKEWDLMLACEEGFEALLELAVEHCGLTMERIRELHRLRFSLINPIVDIVDKCVGAQWLATDNFWNGGVSDASEINAKPSEALFHLAIYGELFGPDMDTYLNQDLQTSMLEVNTRVEYLESCLSWDDNLALTWLIASSR